MSIEKTAPESIQQMLKPLEDGKFRFACHPGVPCFTECCRDLNLLLTPYDIVRLKSHLGLGASEFLDQYTDTELDENRGLPMVYLRMLGDEWVCPFVSPMGCRVYENRPSACRTYPIARASRMDGGTVLEDYFVLRESHCRGFEEGRVWEASEWITDQGLEPYHEMNNLWMRIITHPRLRQAQGLSRGQQQMFFLASYDLDRFRQLVFGGRFLEAFHLPEEEVQAMRESDEALLRLACRWLSYSLLNEPALEMRQQGAR